MSETKKRNWAFIVYPDSAPSDWRDYLDNRHYAWVESPLHDKDITEDGELKKAHWHVLVIFDGPMTSNIPEKLAEAINAPAPMGVGSARGMVRYMIHLDNPEKYQYPRDEMIVHGGLDVEPYFELTGTNRLDILRDISRYVIDNDVRNFVTLVEYAIKENDEWFQVIADKNTLFINKLVDAQWQKGRANND